MQLSHRISGIIKSELSFLGLVDNACILGQILVFGYLGVWFWRWEFWVIVLLQGLRLGVARARLKEELDDQDR